MNYMSTVAILFGLFWSWVCLRSNRIDYLLTIYHYFFFRSKEGFYQVYDMADDELTYEHFYDKNSGIRSYADYLRLHHKVRPSAYKRFNEVYGLLIRVFTERVIPIGLLPAVAFWSHWWQYLVGLGVGVVCMVGSRVVHKRNGLGFYQRIVVYSVLSNYLREEQGSNS